MHQTFKLVFPNPFLAIVVLPAFLGGWGLLLLHQPMDAATGVLIWWTVLCAVSVCNIWAWHLSAGMLSRRRSADDLDAYRFQRGQLLLSAVFVLGCAFRAVLPRGDVQRIGLFDTWVSSVLVGRSVATVAELCFVAQWALWLRQLALNAGSRVGIFISWLLVPLIMVAEVCSWYGVLTTSYLGNVIEESIWALTAALVVITCAALWRRTPAAFRPYLGAVIALGSAYCLYMCTVDVPMYAARWLADEANGREYLSLIQGLADVGSRWVVTHSWDEWSAEVPWMSLYFSVGVWASLALVHARRLGFDRPMAFSTSFPCAQDG